MKKGQVQAIQADGENRDTILVIKVKPSEKEWLVQKAKQLGYSNKKYTNVSRLVREAAFGAIKEMG